jgi:hypothetical protein
LPEKKVTGSKTEAAYRHGDNSRPQRRMIFSVWHQEAVLWSGTSLSALVPSTPALL